MTTEHPIIFQGWSVRANMNCKPGVWPAEPIDPAKPWKWQTRRVIKPQPDPQTKSIDISEDGTYFMCTFGGARRHILTPRCPYGIPGHLVWTRETWGVFSRSFGGSNSEHPGHWLGLCYRGTDDTSENDFDVQVERADWLHYRKPGRWQIWKPSIHMPRWACREVPEVKRIRAERVQDISEEDAIAEGAVFVDFGKDRYGQQLRGWRCGRSPDTTDDALGTARHAFGNVWNAINAKAKRAKKNPYTGAREDCYVLYPWEAVRREKKLKSGLTEYTVGNAWTFAIDFMRTEAKA